MIVIFIAAFFCVLNISLWCVFLMKFKKLFTTQNIIAKTREDMEMMVDDINRNAGRNIDIIEDRIKQLKIVIAEADRHLEIVNRELESQKARLPLQKKNERDFAANHPPVSASYMHNRGAVQRYTENQNISQALQSRNRYELTDEGNRQIGKTAGHETRYTQRDLFEQNEIENSVGTTFTVENDGTSYARVPIINNNVEYSDEPVHTDFSQLVHNLYMAGHSVEEIARETNRSTTEVQLVLSMDPKFEG
ncbi:MAG: hypothetical protein IJ727_00805 [Treponema sp.]|nr:hypothetical protein [Treponema sp.]